MSSSNITILADRWNGAVNDGEFQITVGSYFYRNFTLIQRSTYSLDGTPIATRVSGDTVSGNNGLFYLYTDHLGSSSFMTTSSGTVVAGSTARYKPFGGYRTTPSQTITDRGFTGHLHNDSVGLIYMNARFYLPGVGRFASADTIVPEPGNPQAFNRYSYVYNNPIKHTDPTGHCIFGIPCPEIVTTAYNYVFGVSATPEPKPNNYQSCPHTLSECFSQKWLIDFENREVSEHEFTDMLNTIGGVVSGKDLASVSLLDPVNTYENIDQAKDERGMFDTPFYNGGGADGFNGKMLEDIYPSDQQVCIDSFGCGGRSEINYVAQGMIAAAAGDSLLDAGLSTYIWNVYQYQAIYPPTGKLKWTAIGWAYYKIWGGIDEEDLLIPEHRQPHSQSSENESEER